MGRDRPRTVGELRSSGYRIESVKDEMRRNLVRKLRAGETLFPDILGYEETVFPQIQNAILSRHDMLLLGLRGQAKTRMLRQLVHLLDEFLPVIAGSQLNDHPYHPISKYARDLVAEQGDATPITWIRREQRYHEKLATPDVTIADLIGEVRHDQARRGPLSLQRADNAFRPDSGPGTNRGIFCINELAGSPLPRSRSAFSMCSRSRDIQIRGYPIRLELLDVCNGLLGQSRGLHQPRPDCHTAQGPDRVGRADALPDDPGNRHRHQRAECLARPGWRRGQARQSLAIPLYVKEVIEEIARLAEPRRM